MAPGYKSCWVEFGNKLSIFRRFTNARYRNRWMNLSSGACHGAPEKVQTSKTIDMVGILLESHAHIYRRLVIYHKRI